MKNIMLILIATLLAFPAIAQKKGKVDPKDMTIDSLTTLLDSVSGVLNVSAKALDSTTMELAKYLSMYASVREKVTLRDFDPTTMGQIIDSLRTTRDATFTGLSAESTSLRDSINVLQEELTKQKAAMDSIVALSVDKTPLINELKQLKELLDTGIITQEEFDVRKQKLLERW